ncbi:Protein of unknown function [Cotesia congregata]|uniref:HTH CENPB-type domain-containing protein n=1 Tax=Cotesia congregata TaxID=51543 RepID=A0A8J2ED23_COTCN|nr:Protein of unknown function [Cotesia congregata]
MGFPINREFLIHSVKQLVKAEGMKNPFKDNVPGRKWFEGFLKRHPRVGQKKAEYLCKARAVVTESGIRSWFFHVAEELGENIEILKDPRRVFDMDETAVHLAPKGGLVLAERGKSVYDVAGNEKENVTTLFNVNAAGEFAPPLTIFKYERLPKICVESAPKDWGIGKSENGWMTSESFYEYFTNVFYPFLQKSEIKFPVIVFLDGHVSHMSIHLSKFCKEKQIILCCFPPHATHILQPLDVSFFFPLKQRWKNLIRNWRIENNGADVEKHNVPAFLSKLINEENFVNVIKSGFKACGICPFDADAVDYTKCVEIKESQNAQNISNEPESQKSAQVLSHRQFIESKIDADVLKRFKHAKAAGIAWEADDKYELLYELWVKAIEDDKNVDNDQQSPSCILLASEDLNPSITNDDNVIEFEFLEFSELNFDEVEEPLQSFISHTPNQNPDLGVPLSPEPSILSNINTDSNTIRAVLPSSNNAIQSSPVIIKVIDPNPVSTLSAENVSNSNTITMCRKSLDEVINQIVMWPKKQPSKRKRAVKHLPSVITSNKWIEVMEAKENEKNEKEEERKLKKIEREERIERNKKIKQEKLEEQAKKKSAKQLAAKKPVKSRKMSNK